MCFFLMTFVPVQKLCIYIYIYIYAFFIRVIGRIYTYIYTYTRSAVQFWCSCIPSQSIGLFWGSVRFLCWMLLSLFFGLPIVSCSMINSLILGCLWPLLIVSNNIFDTRYLAFCNISPARMFLSLDLLSEYRIQQGAVGPLYVTSWIFWRGVSGFATDCPCSVWCRGLTTCLLYVGPLFGNRPLNKSWAVGLT